MFNRSKIQTGIVTVICTYVFAGAIGLATGQEPAAEPVDSAAADIQTSSEKSPAPVSRRYHYKKYNNIAYSRGEEFRLLCDVYKPCLLYTSDAADE